MKPPFINGTKNGSQQKLKGVDSAQRRALRGYDDKKAAAGVKRISQTGSGKPAQPVETVESRLGRIFRFPISLVDSASLLHHRSTCCLGLLPGATVVAPPAPAFLFRRDLQT
jgi:hypothetical protein